MAANKKQKFFEASVNSLRENAWRTFWWSAGVLFVLSLPISVIAETWTPSVIVALAIFVVAFFRAVNVLVRTQTKSRGNRGKK